MLSPAGVFSGTSGRQKTTQEWISAKLNCPTRLSLFMGLCGRQRDTCDGEAVAGVVLAEGELVVDAEDGHGGDGRAGLRGLLVLLSALQDFDLQLFQLRPEGEQYDS
ncbi:hypothetical protein EYF80_041850 [Liparis tanakae]|uniref:Uncharacterized protein n=1 Tax=Liparis tanakae TaxID=230148 RepID=A0A4Z2G329_9TELE|nr:hypothetical protein EYF80_041850 [Liparis tanakae]